MKNKDIYKFIRNNIHTSTNKNDDKFVGISYCENKFSISFPMGFCITRPNINDKASLKQFRDDIKLLLLTIKKYYEFRELDDANSDMSNMFTQTGNMLSKNCLPLHSFDFLIKDYIDRGFYYETNIINKIYNSGKINWHRTLKQIKPIFDNNDVIYLKLIRRKQNILGDELITLLHKTCVYESFEKIGFLYFDNNIIQKPNIEIKDAKKYIYIIKEKLKNSFKDKDRLLFSHMINVLEWSESFSNHNEYKYGVAYFHPVWEKMIDKVFGIGDISEYYPQATWYDLDGRPLHQASNMRQDTIMEYNNELYVLDAKYYAQDNKPGTADTNKQITYGRTVESIDDLHRKPYNAYILPASLDGEDLFKCNCYTTIDSLEDYKFKKYGKVAAIYIDTKKLMEMKFQNANNDLKRKLAEYIWLIHERSNPNENIVANDVIQTLKENISSNREALAANINMGIFEPIYQKIFKLLDDQLG